MKIKLTPTESFPYYAVHKFETNTQRVNFYKMIERKYDVNCALAHGVTGLARLCDRNRPLIQLFIGDYANSLFIHGDLVTAEELEELFIEHKLCEAL